MTRPHVRFDASPWEFDLITEIVVRACSLLPDLDRLSLAMDITAVHLNDCALDLSKLMEAPDFDFAHDISGIIAHVDRRTGKLRDHFLPRCAKPELAATHARAR